MVHQGGYAGSISPCDHLELTIGPNTFMQNLNSDCVSICFGTSDPLNREIYSIPDR